MARFNDQTERGWGTLELLHQDDNLQGPGFGPAGAAFMPFMEPWGGHTFADPYCVSFDFRVTSVPWGDLDYVESQNSAGTGDGFALAFLDRSLTNGLVFQNDWSTEGGLGGGYLGAVGFGGNLGEDLGWLVEFDMFSNDGDPAGHDPHVGLSRITSADSLEPAARFAPGIVNNTGVAGTTDLDSPPGAIPTSQFQEVPDASFDEAVRDAGWHQVMVGWNPRRAQSANPINTDTYAQVAVWLAGEDEIGQPFSMMSQPLVPPPPDSSFTVSHGMRDGANDPLPMLIGFTAGKNSAQSTFEVDNVRLVCAPCPRFAGPGELPPPEESGWFHSKKGLQPPPEDP